MPLPPRDRERGTRKDEERRPVDEGEEPVGTSVEGNSSRAQMPATNKESLSINQSISYKARNFAVSHPQHEESGATLQWTTL